MVTASLDLSINTVKTLVKRCYQKLNVNSITAAMAKTFSRMMIENYYSGNKIKMNFVTLNDDKFNIRNIIIL
ncbi:MAG: hypothetical protein IPJ13_23305 [Saprospiraceae bacterium]|nr:hypothetical protein [Saprospiraceae bacterium]